MAYSGSRKGRGRAKRGAKRKYGVSKKLVRAMRKVDTEQEFRRQPMLRVVKNHHDNITLTTGIIAPRAAF